MSRTAARHRIVWEGLERGALIGTLSLMLVVSVAAVAAAATYYVDNQSAACSNTGAGTEAQPYCTIAGALAAHSGPDVVIIVKPGVYREQITVPGSGSSGLPFAIRAQGPGVVIDGADSFASPAAWAASSGTVFVAAAVTWSPKQVFVDEVRLTPSTAAPGLLPVNAFTWVSGQGLYVNLGGDNPGVHQTLVGRRSYGFNLFSKTFVTIEGFEIAHTEDRGINIQNGCTDLVVAANRVRFANSYGIQTVNGQRLLIDGNVVSDCNLHGIGLINGASACIIRNNESFHNADPAIRRANGIYMLGAPGNTLYGNRLHDNQDTGMQFTSGANSNVSYNNRSWNNGDHGYDHLGASGTIHVNDVAFGNYKDGFSIEGNSPSSQLYNCIAVDNGLTTNEYDLWVNDSSSVGFVADYNIFWNSTAQPPFKYVTTVYTTLGGYQAASGQDAHSVQANPVFANGAGGDFLPLAGSPAIDAANSAVPNWPATDAVGTARKDDPATANHGAGPVTYADIGALEFTPATDHPPVVVAPSLVNGSENLAISFGVTASDPDGQAIASLTADLSGLPARNNARFRAGTGNTSGTLTWTPTYADSGSYVVTFRAANVLIGAATTTIRVRNVDRAPVVTCPSLATVAVGGLVTFPVSAADPDGDPIQSLTMVLSKMPANSGAIFVANGSNTAGTFTWPVATPTGKYQVRFVAANVLSGSSVTAIQVKKSTRLDGTSTEDELPVVVLALSNGFPNPSREAVEFALDLPNDAAVRWAVFDLQGRMVWAEDRVMTAGRNRLRWDGTTTSRARAATGVYLVRASIDGTQFTRRVVRF